jgi:putative oxidoreductase
MVLYSCSSNIHDWLQVDSGRWGLSPTLEVSIMNEARNIALGTLVLRLSLGTMLLAHGLLKVLVFTVPGTVQFFVSVGFPGWLAYLVIAMELTGSMLLIGGIATRWVATALVPIMLGAASVHWENGWVFSAPNGGWEYPVLLAVLMAVQALLGSGAYALVKQGRSVALPARA